jgi:hypothetical protein
MQRYGKHKNLERVFQDVPTLYYLQGHRQEGNKGLSFMQRKWEELSDRDNEGKNPEGC